MFSSDKNRSFPDRTNSGWVLCFFHSSQEFVQFAQVLFFFLFPLRASRRNDNFEERFLARDEASFVGVAIEAFLNDDQGGIRIARRLKVARS